MELLQKISVIQKKILVGGENLFEKAQQQQFLLETSFAEIENLDKSQQQLEETLQKKGVMWNNTISISFNNIINHLRLNALMLKKNILVCKKKIPH